MQRLFVYNCLSFMIKLSLETQQNACNKTANKYGAKMNLLLFAGIRLTYIACAIYYHESKMPMHRVNVIDPLCLANLN